jgi:hypothetical protein
MGYYIPIYWFKPICLAFLVFVDLWITSYRFYKFFNNDCLNSDDISVFKVSTDLDLELKSRQNDK